MLPIRREYKHPKLCSDENRLEYAHVCGYDDWVLSEFLKFEQAKIYAKKVSLHITKHDSDFRARQSPY